MVGRAEGDEADVGICPAAFCGTEVNAGTPWLILKSGVYTLAGWETDWFRKLLPPISLWVVHPRFQSRVISAKPARTTVSRLTLQAKPKRGRKLLLSRFQRNPLGWIQPPTHPPDGQVRTPGTEPL